MAKLKTYRTAAQQDLTLRTGLFLQRLKCFGCGAEWVAKRGGGEAEANSHGAACRWVPNRKDVGAEVQSAIMAALNRM